MEGDVMIGSLPVSEEYGRWQGFYDALRAKDKEAFNRLVAGSRRHPSAMSNSGLEPFEAFMLCLLLEFEKRLEALEKEKTIRQQYEEETSSP
jgi:hypothetical protein